MTTPSPTNPDTNMPMLTRSVVFQVPRAREKSKRATVKKEVLRVFVLRQTKADVK